jgi:ubiquitin
MALFDSSDKLLIIKTPNNNKIFTSYKDTNTFQDVYFTLRNIIKYKLFEQASSEIGYKLSHNKKYVDPTMPIHKLNTDSSYLEIKITPVNNKADLDHYSEDIQQIIKTNDIKNKKDYNFLKSSASRQDLRNWAKNHAKLKINGNTRSQEILDKIEFFYKVNRQVFVKSLTGKTITIQTKNCDCVAQIISEICNKEGVPPDQQRLVYCGKQLCPDRRLFDEIDLAQVDVNESTIHMILRLRGGMYDEKSGRNGEYKAISDLSKMIFRIQSPTDTYYSDTISIQDIINEEQTESC